MTEEKPLVEWKPIIALAEEILGKSIPDYRTAQKLFISLSVLRQIGGHPAVFRSEVMEALRSERTKKN